MDEFVKQTLQIILHERMKTKAELEVLTGSLKEALKQK